MFISGPTENIHFSTDAFMHIFGLRTFDIRCFCKIGKNFHKRHSTLKYECRKKHISYYRPPCRIVEHLKCWCASDRKFFSCCVHWKSLGMSHRITDHTTFITNAEMMAYCGNA